MGDPAHYHVHADGGGFLVFPVPSRRALEWWKGNLSDNELILSPFSPGDPDAAFIASLFGGQHTRALWRAFREIHPGLAVLRSTHPTTARWARRFGALAGFQDGPGEVRWLGTAEACKAFSELRRRRDAKTPTAAECLP